jgi:hypothetical protein
MRDVLSNLVIDTMVGRNKLDSGWIIGVNGTVGGDYSSAENP